MQPELCAAPRVKSMCPNMKTQTAPALSGSSKRASSKKLMRQKQRQIIMPPSKWFGIEPKS